MGFLGGGGEVGKAVDIWVTHAFSVIGSNCVPVPGGIGVIDFLLIDGMKDLMSESDAISLELASRGISFYICVLACILIVGVGYFVIRKRGDIPQKEVED
jgi:uncharacterized membrane protein YbhN (UPF0104 family)